MLKFFHKKLSKARGDEANAKLSNPIVGQKTATKTKEKQFNSLDLTRAVLNSSKDAQSSANAFSESAGRHPEFECRYSSENSARSIASFERNEMACDLVERMFQRPPDDIEAAISALAAAAAHAPDAVAAAFDEDGGTSAAAAAAAAASPSKADFGAFCQADDSEDPNSKEATSAMTREDASGHQAQAQSLQFESNSPEPLSAYDLTALKSAPSIRQTALSAASAHGLSLAIGFQAGGLRHGWSVLVTAVPAQGKPTWSVPQFDWCASSGDASSDYLVRVTFSSGGDKDYNSHRKRLIKVVKYPLQGQPIQLPALRPQTKNRQQRSSINSTTSEVRVLTAQTEASLPCSGRLIGLYCTASYVTLAIRQRDNIEVRVYNSDLWPISVEHLMRNTNLVKEAFDSSDIVNEKVQCLTVDKAEQTLMYFHSYRVLSGGSKQLQRLCSLSLPDLQLSRRLPLKEDVKSIKIGSKYFALYYRDSRLVVYCKASRTAVFEFSPQKLAGLFQPGDTFELDSQDRLVEVSQQRVRSLFYNGVMYRDCECVNLQELSRRHLIGRRGEFYEALQCHLATVRLQHHQSSHHGGGGVGGGCSKKACTMRARLRINAKLLRGMEDFIIAGQQCGTEKQQPNILVCDGDAFWLEAVAGPDAGATVESFHQQQQQLQQQQQQLKHDQLGKSKSMH